MSKDEPGKEFSHVVEVDRIGPQGLQVQLEADQAACVALARRMRILKVLSLKANLRITPDSVLAGHFQLAGQLEAEVEQACVVSLEPVHELVSETFLRRFGPETVTRPKADLAEDEAEWLDPEAEDPADPIIGGQIDVGEVVTEELALGLDPYPRKPEAALPKGYRPDVDDGAKISPFAALAKLKTAKKD
ncbi:MAG: DUF177 domain-containing protein [Ferrovibrio sp.]|uniref:YceD family protein n=1 Tax=Ferrovibrio sp. TaxID=1917215 RepID=UPI0026119995|nr:DUF177 domain-containing protein [Ferrovibrio sp.]MCW0236489.1 DUF177 domain-containing protein [Ferrovibrio sp.]